MTYRGRFAPSPTGPLHFGSLVAAVASYLDARASGGSWLVRIEDVDSPRRVPDAEGQILRTLERFGLRWDEPIVRQSARTALYREALERLRARGLVYRCQCSRREIADSATAGIDGLVYPGTCRNLALDARVEGAERLCTPDRTMAFHDRCMGPIAQNVAREIGDFVLLRRDGLFAYQLAVVVDDAEQRVTDVVRGADLLLSTPRQILLQQLLGNPTPRYLHIPVATNAAGQKLSKQSLAAPVDPADPGAGLRQALAFLGQEEPDAQAPASILEAAVARWDCARIPRRPSAPVTFRDPSGESPSV